MKKLKPTIRMPKELLAAWLKALRGGKLRQATGTLLDCKTGAMCCLGVLEYVATGSRKYIERREGDWLPNYTPSKDWLRQHRIEFFYGPTPEKLNESNTPSLFGGPLPGTGCATDYNDCTDHRGRHKYPFKVIADLIEKNAEGY